jgi:hypothetical protein
MHVTIERVDAHDARSGFLASWTQMSPFPTVSSSSFHHNFYDGIALYTSEHLTMSDFFCYQNDSAGLSLDNNLSLVDFHDGEPKVLTN